VADSRFMSLQLGAGLLVWHAYATEWAISILRLMAVLPLIAFAQGFLVLRAATGRSRIDLEFIILSAGTSVAITIVLGLVLHAFNAITAVGWIVASGVVCAGAIGWSALTRDRAERPAVPPRHAVSRKTIVCFGIMAALFAGAAAVAHHGAVNQRQFAFTELWIVPTDGRSAERVSVGVKNEEQRPSTYVLELVRNGRLLARLPPFSLNDGEQRVEVIPISVDAGVDQRLEARLHKSDDPLFIRRVWLSNATTETGQCAC